MSGRRFIFLFVLILFAATAAHSQSSRRKKKSPVTPRQQSTSLNPYYPTAEDYAPKAKTSFKGITFDQQVKDFYKRKRKILRNRVKLERELQKPQYTDPSYFGHRRPPKKRPPGKMKFCKECGLWH